MNLAIYMGCLFILAGLAGLWSTFKQKRDYTVMDIVACAFIATLGGGLLHWGIKG